jgi:uncharacterized OB-fold protein
MPSPTQTKLDELYALLMRDKPPAYKCRKCGQEVFIPMVYIPPTGVARKHRRHLEAVNRAQTLKAASGNIICTDCALAS